MRRTALLLRALQPIVVLVLLFGMLGVPGRDLHVPFRFSNDSLQYQVISKGNLDGAWWWHNPRASAPFGFEAVQYPVNGNVDQAIVWVVSRLTGVPGLSINFAWCLMVALAAVIATACLSILGASPASALTCGTLYAFLPYSLSRDIDLFHIVTWLVPVPCTVALLVAGGHVPVARVTRWALLCGMVLVGLDYVYNAFFGAFVVVMGIASALVRWHVGALRFGMYALALITVLAAVNLAPTALAWHRDGKPVTMFAKVPAEAEIFGLKIRHLVSPILSHTIAPLRWAVEAEQSARFPYEQENVTARLGLVASAGFLLLLALLLLPQARRLHGGAESEQMLTAARLVLACVLLATVGGFGSLFNLFVAPDVRAYNRITPFIGFLSLAGAASLVDGLGRVWLPRWRSGVGAVAAVILALGLWDQSHALLPLQSIYAGVASEYERTRKVVAALEARLPTGAAVFQLPFSYFLGDDGIGRMGPYDNARPYLVSRTLEWSFPAMSNPSTFWGRAVSRMPLPQMLPVLRGSGFSGVLVDRFGFADNANGLVRELEDLVGRAAIVTIDDRYAAFDIRGVTAQGMPDGLTKDPRQTPATIRLNPCHNPSAVGFIDRVANRFVNPGQVMPVRRQRSVDVRGWAVWHEQRVEAGAVDVAIDDRPVGTFYGLERHDVVAAYAIPGYRLSGFVGTIPASAFAAGPHALTLRVVSPDRTCYQNAFELRVYAD
jgi:hypothetical protein